ncbi:MAG: hypothetical protein GX647_10430 [Clostridiales bacterium]|jgi:hypothetical protein|nr:hypothetical protein [Clostridiales bacterium]OPZ66976.1 MAG: hypothetical protein BWY81_01553 [Firmicutes bacterium ADurb.Bin467]
MKRWICCILALALMLLPTCASAMSFNFGLKDKRTDVPVAQTEAPAVEPQAPKLGFSVTTPAPGAGELDLTAMTDAELYDLLDRIYEELDARAPEPTPIPSIEDGLMLIDQRGVRMSLYDSAYDADSQMIRFYVIVENNTGKAISISVNDPVADGVEVYGLGVYDVADGATVSDYFLLEPIEGEEDVTAYALENPREITFTFEVWEDDTYETMFFQDCTLTAD